MSIRHVLQVSQRDLWAESDKLQSFCVLQVILLCHRTIENKSVLDGHHQPHSAKFFQGQYAGANGLRCPQLVAAGSLASDRNSDPARGEGWWIGVFTLPAGNSHCRATDCGKTKITGGQCSVGRRSDGEDHVQKGASHHLPLCRGVKALDPNVVDEFLVCKHLLFYSLLKAPYCCTMNRISSLHTTEIRLILFFGQAIGYSRHATFTISISLQPALPPQPLEFQLRAISLVPQVWLQDVL